MYLTSLLLYSDLRQNSVQGVNAVGGGTSAQNANSSGPGQGVGGSGGNAANSGSQNNQSNNKMAGNLGSYMHGNNKNLGGGKIVGININN